MRFSVVIPALNEGNRIAFALQQLLAGIEYLSEVEIIVCDGGSSDDTQQQVRTFPVLLNDSPKGRARQMNHGASQAIGDWILFLHADTSLPDDWMNAIEQCGKQWGRFDVRLSGKHRLLRMVEKMMNVRSRRTAVATGDQAMFFQREFFQRIGGFPEVPLMEDIAISKIARAHADPAPLRQQVVTSSRRWEKQGILRTIVLMWWLRFAYWLGISPQRLHRWYYG